MKEIGSCKAVLYKVMTTLDGGFRVTIDLPESEAEIATKLLKLCGQDKVLTLGIIQDGQTD